MIHYHLRNVNVFTEPFVLESPIKKETREDKLVERVLKVTEDVEYPTALVPSNGNKDHGNEKKQVEMELSLLLHAHVRQAMENYYLVTFSFDNFLP